MCQGALLHCTCRASPLPACFGTIGMFRVRLVALVLYVLACTLRDSRQPKHFETRSHHKKMSAAPNHSTEVNWLAVLLKHKFQYDVLREFQLTGVLGLVQNRDIFLVVAPGMGKTSVLFGPLSAGRVGR